MIPTEEFFLKYAFPCAHVLLEQKTMSSERYKELEDSIKNHNPPSRQTIESSFPAAFRRIKNLASEMGVEDYWDRRVVEEYWHNGHNQNIERKDGNYARFPSSFRDFCKVHTAEVIGILPEGFLLAKYENQTRPVSREYIPDAKVGDKVRIHHAYAIERADK